MVPQHVGQYTVAAANLIPMLYGGRSGCNWPTTQQFWAPQMRPPPNQIVPEQVMTFCAVWQNLVQTTEFDASSAC